MRAAFSWRPKSARKRCVISEDIFFFVRGLRVCKSDASLCDQILCAYGRVRAWFLVAKEVCDSCRCFLCAAFATSDASLCAQIFYAYGRVRACFLMQRKTRNGNCKLAQNGGECICDVLSWRECLHEWCVIPTVDVSLMRFLRIYTSDASLYAQILYAYARMSLRKTQNEKLKTRAQCWEMCL